jgi:hypothetical protein
MMPVNPITKGEIQQFIIGQHHELDQLVADLSDTQWIQPGVVKRWSVKDIVSVMTSGEQRVTEMIRVAVAHPAASRSAEATNEIWPAALDQTDAAIVRACRRHTVTDVQLHWHSATAQLRDAFDQLPELHVTSLLFAGQSLVILLDIHYQTYQAYCSAICTWRGNEMRPIVHM